MTTAKTIEPVLDPWLEVVRRKVAAMRFGSVQIVVHEGRVTQVESTEKTRLAVADPSREIVPRGA